MCAGDIPKQMNGVRTASTFEVPARTELEVMACLDTSVKDGTWILEGSLSSSATQGVMVACAIVQPSSSTIPVRLVNCTLEPVTSSKKGFSCVKS